MGTKSTIDRKGELLEEELEVKNQAFRYEQRSIYSGQLSGTHVLNERSNLVWIGGLGYTNRLEPDFRRFTSSRILGSDDDFIINLQQFEAPTLQQGARFYSYLNEALYTGALNYNYLLGQNQLAEEKRYQIKTGFYSELKDRSFQARWFGLVNPNRLGSDLLHLDPKEFFDESNISSTKIYYAEGTNFDDKYDAQNLLLAGYASLYAPIAEKLNATVGVRAEYNVQEMHSRQRGGGSNIVVNNPTTFFLPSLNMVYNISPKSLVRFGYGMTVNRPEFRELAPFTYYDFAFDVSKRGNPDVKTATIQNLDLRFDFYPSKSELITLGVFYKRFKNPIESAIFYNGSNISFTVENALSAISAGIEAEVRKDINPLFTFVANASLIKSNVSTSGNDNRFMQGQSPYLINAGLFFNEPNAKIQVNVMYNIIGKRIFVIGDNVLSANVYEMPRNVIDVNISKKINRAFEIKIGVQDLLNQPFKLIQDTNRDKKITDTDGVFQEFTRGSNYFLSLSYKIN